MRRAIANAICRPGDQHKSSSAAAANPFLEPGSQDKKPQLTPYTAQEIATLQSRLDKQLGPEYISSRQGPGGQKVHYLQAEKVINLANEVFGFNGWSSQIQNIQIDFVDENPQTGRVSLGLSVIVRIILRDGTYHEDIGYGHVENAKGKAAAFEKAKKSGTSDGVKRALRNFGKVLGNCVYDKDYLGRVTKLKVGAGTKWDPEALHRHPDFVVKKQQPTKPEPQQSEQPQQQFTTADVAQPEVGDSFDAMDFDDAVFDDDEFGNPDEFVVPSEPPKNLKRPGPAAQRPPASRAMTTPSRPPHVPTKGQPVPTGNSIAHTKSTVAPAARGNAPTPGLHPQNPTTTANGNPKLYRSSSPGIPSQHFGGPQVGLSAAKDFTAPRGTGFFSARAAESIDENNIPAGGIAPAFNPHYESPSLRRTPNIDHSKSMRLLRNLKPDTEPSNGLAAAEQQPTDQSPKPPVAAGAPQTPVAPGRGFTSQYRPPTRRAMDGPSANAASGPVGVLGGVDKVMHAARRPPLSDVSNVPVQHQATSRTPEGADVKRQRLSDTGVGQDHNENGNVHGLG
jgi:DNA repair and recombination protein RAD52